MCITILLCYICHLCVSDKNDGPDRKKIPKRIKDALFSDRNVKASFVGKLTDKIQDRVRRRKEKKERKKALKLEERYSGDFPRSVSCHSLLKWDLSQDSDRQSPVSKKRNKKSGKNKSKNVDQYLEVADATGGKTVKHSKAKRGWKKCMAGDINYTDASEGDRASTRVKSKKRRGRQRADRGRLYIVNFKIPVIYD